VIAGCGQTRLGKLGETAGTLVKEALDEALADAGLQRESLRGLISMPALGSNASNAMDFMPAHKIATDLGLLTRPGGQDFICRTVDCGGASPVVALREACTLLREEKLGCVAVVGGDVVGSMQTNDFLSRLGNNSGSPAIPSKYDDFARWHMDTFGTTREELASVPVFMSMQAAKNPDAMSKGQVTLTGVLNSGKIASATNLYECAKRADGAAALIVTSRGFAEDRGMLHHCVPILGVGEASAAYMPDKSQIGVHSLPISLAAHRALEKSKTSLDQIDWFGLYDCFPVAFVSALEQVGLCGYGEGGKWVKGACEALSRGEKVGVNTHGGLLGAGAPWEVPAMFTLIEAVRQILGKCEPARQIPQVSRALVQANGGTFSHQAVAILGPPQYGKLPADLSCGDSPEPFPTSLTKLLGVKYPVMGAGMAGVARARLVAAVSEAGGMGCIGAGLFPKEEMMDEIEQVKRLTSKPFAVNILAVEDKIEEKIQAIATSGVRAMITGLGVARSAVDLMHAHGVLVGVVCGQVKHAMAAVDAGCDFVIAQGTEAGGHTGNVALMPLLTQVRQAVPTSVPVVAAGGVYNGKTFTATLSLGAAGVWIGTRFLLSYEANTVKGYKEKVLVAKGKDNATTITRYYTGKPCRVLINDQTREFDKAAKKADAFPKQYLKSKAEGTNHLFDGKPETKGVDTNREFMPAGQVIRSIDHVLPAKMIIHSIISEARDCISQLEEQFANRPSKL